MMVDYDQVKEDFARKDSEYRKLKEKYDNLEMHYAELQATENNQRGFLVSFGRREEELEGMLAKLGESIDFFYEKINLNQKKIINVDHSMGHRAFSDIKAWSDEIAEDERDISVLETVKENMRLVAIDG